MSEAVVRRLTPATDFFDWVVGAQGSDVYPDWYNHFVARSLFKLGEELW